MTRIIAGRLGGRRIAAPKGAATRPTSERVREAVFARIDARMDLQGATVLDLYAGSGALGLEAASRGARSVLLVESDRAAARVIQRNVDDLGLGGVASVRTDRVERLLRGRADTAYDLVLLDPPYQMTGPQLGLVLQALVDQEWLSSPALVVVERSTRSPVPAWPAAFATLEPRVTGETTVHYATA